MVVLFVTPLMVFTPTVSADFSDGLILHHAYDEGEGSLAADLSGNGHDGEISNPEWVDGKFGKALKFGGEDDEVRLWNRALSAEDIAALKDLPTAVDAQAELTTTWGDIKTVR